MQYAFPNPWWNGYKVRNDYFRCFPERIIWNCLWLHVLWDSSALVNIWTLQTHIFYPSTSTVLYNHEQVMLPFSGWASFAVPWNDQHFRAYWVGISCPNLGSLTVSSVFCCCILFHIFLMDILDSSEYLGLGSWLLPLLPLTEHFRIISPLRVAVAPKHACRQRIQLPDTLSYTSISLSPCWGMSMARDVVTPGLVKRRNTTWAEHPQYHY